MTKLNLGSGDERFEDYLLVDKYDKEAQLKLDVSNLSDIEDDSIESIVAFQVLEHVPYHLTDQTLKEWYRVLKPSGDIWIEVPELYYAFKKVIDGDWEDWVIWNIWGQYHRPWDEQRYGKGCKFHKPSIHYQGFDFKRLKGLLEKTGFKKIRQITDIDQKHSHWKENLSVRAIK